MEQLLTALQGSELALALRFSRWGYAAVNTAHVLGIALLVGAIMPLDLCLLGAWPGCDRRILVRVLAPMAAGGLILAIMTGLPLFAVRAGDYADLTLFRIKLGLIVIGLFSAFLLHAAHGFLLETASERRLRIAAILSIFCWLGALVAGRLIAFVSG